jgi:predicted nucleic acid-binding protein
VICVDASVAIKWLLPDNEGYADNALALLNEIDERAEIIVAPPLLWSEKRPAAARSSSGALR